jgi:CRISPR/Cas system type I-B associated protein Csh2 (Cas7 group RAMP superfamily)
MIRRKLDDIGDELDQVTEGLSPKVRRLIELLQLYRPRGFPPTMTLEERINACEEAADLQLCGIVFVQRRTTCEVSFSHPVNVMAATSSDMIIEAVHLSFLASFPFSLLDSEELAADVREANGRARFHKSRARVWTQRSGLDIQGQGELVDDGT